MMNDEDPAFMQEQQAIVARCSAVLAGHDPRAQGAAIADLFAQWLHGHYPLDGTPLTQVRAELKAHTLELVDALLDVYDRKPRPDAH